MNGDRRELQRLWLDARCASVGAVGQAAKMNAFLLSFLSQFATRHDPEFQRVFGTGTDLAQLVCKSFITETNAIEQHRRDPRSVETVSYMRSLLSTLVILVSGFTVGEVTYFAPLYELLADSAAISAALLLHQNLSASKAPQEPDVVASPDCDLTALECLKLTTQILACPHEGLVRRCSLEAAQPVNVSEICRVLTSSITTPYRMSDAECPLAQGYVRRVAPVAAQKTLSIALTNLEESLVSCNCPAAAPDATGKETHRSGFAVSLACLMETIILLYKTLNRPFRDHFSFGAFASSMISAEDVLEVHPKYLFRIITCIETIATSTTYTEQSTAMSASPMRQGLLKFVPGSLQTLKQKIVDATVPTSSKPAESNTSGVTCPEAFECLVTLFICSTQPVTSKYYGECVMKLLQLPDPSASLADFFLRSGVESITSLQAQQLSLLFDAAQALSSAASSSSPTRDVVSTFVAGVVQALRRGGLATVERRSLTIDFLTTVSEASPVYKAIVLRDGALGACLTGIVETLQQSHPEGAALLSKASILSKVVVDGPACTEDLNEQRYPTQMIECMLACYTADLADATLVLRDMLTSLVSKTGHFFSPLITALAVATQPRPWRQETSLLLATFASVLQRGKHTQKAVESNAVELLLTLLCQVDASVTPNLDVHLIGTTLAFLFRLLRFSDVWVLFDATISSLRAEPVVVQMVVDLCCGFFHTSPALRRCYAVFDGATAARQNVEAMQRDHHVTFGPYQLPAKPFVELDYPLRALVGWCASGGGGGAAGEALADLVEFLFASSPRRFDNDTIVPFIEQRKCTMLLRKVANIADRRLVAYWKTDEACFDMPYTEAAAQICARQEAWCAALQPQYTGSGAKKSLAEVAADPTRVILLGEGGGISGSVSCGEEHWPSRDGYSVAMWVRWSPSSVSSADTEAGSAAVPLWRLAWTQNRKAYTVRLTINPSEESVIFSCDGGDSSGKVRSPARALKADAWTHIVVVHDRSSFNASEAALFVDGRRVVVSPCSFPAPSWQPSLQNAVLGSAQVEMASSIGSSLDHPTRGIRVDLTSWKVFNQALTLDDITSLYCCGPQPIGGFVCAARSNQTEFPLETPSYPREVVQGLEMCAVAGHLSEGGGSGSNVMLTTSTPATHIVLDVDARSLAPHEVDDTHFRSQEWSLHNSTSARGRAVLVLHGSWSAGALENDCSSDATNALFAHGGARELRRWMQWLRRPLASTADAPTRDTVGSTLVRVMSLCQHQSILAAMEWGDVLADLADTITLTPAAFFGVGLGDPGWMVDRLLSLCLHTVQVRSGRVAPLVHSTVLLEHLLFNWQVLVNANIVSLTALLGSLTALLEPSNPFAALNAQRFRQANFEDGFVYGLFMEWVPPFALQTSVHLIGLFLRAIVVSSEEPTSNLLALCALSVPSANGDCRLGSQMVLAAPEYVALVRNLLLRVLNEVCDESDGTTPRAKARPSTPTAPAGSRPTGSSLLLMDQLCDLLPPCWFVQMMSPASHPVTVTLACRLFVLCFHHSGTFRARHAEVSGVCFEAALSHFAHHENVLALLLEGFAGRVPSIDAPSDATGRRTSTGPIEWDATNARQRYGPLLQLALHLVKAQAEALLTDQFPLYYPPTDSASYFSHFAMQAARTCARVAKLRRCYLAVLFCVRIGHRVRGVAPMDPGAIPTLSAPVPTGNLRRLLARLMTQTIQRLAGAYETAPTLRAVLYSQGASVNPLDALMWPIISSVRVTGADALSPFVFFELLKNEDARALSDSEDMSNGSAASLGDSARDAGGDVTWRGDATVSMPVASPKTGFSSLPYLDALAPKDQMETVFEANRDMFLRHARHYVRQADMVSASAGKASVSGFVWALHRALVAQPVASGTETENLRAAFLCAVWLKTAELALGTPSSDTAPSAASSKNVMSVGKYLLSRLAAGLPVPPETLARHFRALLMRFERQRELARFARTALFEWFMLVVNKSYFQTDSEVASGVVNMVSSMCDVMLQHTFPTTEMAQTVALRLTELTLVVMTDTSTQADGVGKRLCGIWTAYLNAHQESPSLSFLYVGDGAADAWLLSPSPSVVTPVECPTWECFTRWFSRFHVGFLQILRAQPLNVTFSFAEPQPHLKLMRASEKQRADELRRTMRRRAEAVETAAKEWSVFQGTATVVDPVFLRATTDASGTIDHADLQGDDGGVKGYWTLFSNGEVSRLPATPPATERNGWSRQQPLRRFLRYTPPPCVPMRASAKDTKVGPCKLYRNAVNLLTRLASTEMPATPLWVGNVYHIIGIEAHISTLVLTERELLIIRCSQVTPDGDFFIARIQPHTASTQSRQLRENTIYATLRRFLPGHGAGKRGNAQSAAAFRFSQYYRQLRSDVSGGENATVCRVPLASLAAAHERLFLHLPAAMEFVLESGERLLVVVLDEELSFSRPTLQGLMQAVRERVERVLVDTIAAKRARLALATRQWTAREMSNQQYLAVLNDTASRTVADLSQYPVMPWVLADYRSPALTLSDPSVYRPLGTPVGALDPVRAERLRERFRDWVVESGEPPFHFGTHYSTSAIVMYYLVRLEPLTTWAKRFQGGKLDLADRLFHSIADAWESSSGSNTGDVKELIPEFFTMAAFLCNRNQLALGERRDGTVLGDVVLPTWALNTPHRFVHFNSVALESEQVSAHLSEWIDLIFGFKQQGDEAAKAVNVFSHTSYRDGVESAINRASTEEDRKSIVASVDNFGQTPPQLFTNHAPHPTRARPETCVTMQQYLRQHLGDLRIVGENAAVPAGSRSYAVSQLLYAAAQEQLLSCSWLETASAGGVDDSPQLFVYDTCRDAVQCYLRRAGRLLAVTPTIESVGCGQYTAMCATSSGNLLLIGTSTGTVMAFRRKHPRGSYTLSSLLPLSASSTAHNPVVGMQLFQDRRLFVYHERDCLMRGWCLTQLGGGSTLTFEVHLVTPSDDSPVMHTAVLEYHDVLIAVKRQSICVLASDGTILTIIALDAIPSSPANASVTAPLTSAAIAAVCVFNCQSFDTQDLLFLGHADGVVSAMQLEAAHNSTQSTSLFTATHIGSIRTSVPVTCLLAVETMSAVAVGGADGKTRLLRFPAVDSSDSE